MPSWLWPILPMNTMDSQDGLKLIALPLFLNIFFHFQMDWFGKCHALVSEWFSLKISLDLNIPYIVKHRIHVWVIFILSTSSHFPAQATLSMLATGGSGSFTFYQAVCWKCIYYWIMGDTTVSGPPASWSFDFLAKIPQDHSYISPGTI